MSLSNPSLKLKKKPIFHPPNIQPHPSPLTSIVYPDTCESCLFAKPLRLLTAGHA